MGRNGPAPPAPSLTSQGVQLIQSLDRGLTGHSHRASPPSCMSRPLLDHTATNTSRSFQILRCPNTQLCFLPTWWLVQHRVGSGSMRCAFLLYNTLKLNSLQSWHPYGRSWLHTLLDPPSKCDNLHFSITAVFSLNLFYYTLLQVNFLSHLIFSKAWHFVAYIMCIDYFAKHT